MQNVAKYASASSVALRLDASNGWLNFSVTDDGSGFDADGVRRGSGLQNMVDRLAALGGSLEVRSAIGKGTTIAGHVPVAPEPAGTDGRHA
jgi:signal transduction histidine kinase